MAEELKFRKKSEGFVLMSAEEADRMDWAYRAVTDEEMFGERAA